MRIMQQRLFSLAAMNSLLFPKAPPEIKRVPLINLFWTETFSRESIKQATKKSIGSNQIQLREKSQEESVLEIHMPVLWSLWVGWNFYRQHMEENP